MSSALKIQSFVCSYVWWNRRGLASFRWQPWQIDSEYWTKLTIMRSMQYMRQSEKFTNEEFVKYWNPSKISWSTENGLILLNVSDFFSHSHGKCTCRCRWPTNCQVELNEPTEVSCFEREKDVNVKETNWNLLPYSFLQWIHKQHDTELTRIDVFSFFFSSKFAKQVTSAEKI